MNVMVDLETLGNSSHSAIISIGAVEFTEDGLGRDFYCLVDPQSCQDYRLRMDASTVMWWMQQSDQARAAFKGKGLTLDTALASFTEWFNPKACMWGNGATFDNVILDNAYKAAGMKRPWHFTKDRCYRTLKALYPQIKADDREGTYHNALDDAVYQANHAIKILKGMK